MRYLTDRKRAVGKGASRTGTEHHWYMQASAVGLVFLVPVFVYCIGRALSLPYGEAWAFLCVRMWRSFSVLRSSSACAMPPRVRS